MNEPSDKIKYVSTPVPEGAYNYQAPPAPASPAGPSYTPARPPAAAASPAYTPAPMSPPEEPDYDIIHAPAIEEDAPHTPASSAVPVRRYESQMPASPAAPPSPATVRRIPPPADSGDPALQNVPPSAVAPPTVPPAPQRSTVQGAPAVVPAPDRPLYTTEVTFTTPRETEAAAGAPPIIGEPTPARPDRDPVADPYTSVTHPGRSKMTDKKKLDPSVEVQQERRVSRGRPGGR